MNSHLLPSKIRMLVVTALAAFCLTSLVYGQADAVAPDARQFREDILVFGKDFVLKEHEISRNVVVIGGNATIEGTVRGDVIVVFGSAKITGKIERELFVVLGGASVGEAGRIDRDVVVVGGSLQTEPGAVISGARHEIVLGDRLPDLQWIGDWVMRGLLMARPLPPQFGWVWMVAALFLVIYVMLAALFPKPAAACVEALVETPAGSFFAGLLGFALIGPLICLLAVSVAGIPVIPVVLFALVAAVLFGKMAVYRATGERLGIQLNAPILQQPLVALLAGLIIFYLLYTIPVLGFMAWTVAAVWGLGAVLVATISSFRSDRPAEPLVVSRTIAPTTPHAPSHEHAVATGPTTPPAGLKAETDTAVAEPPPMTLSGTTAVAFERAGFWVRLIATLLDFVLLCLFISVFRRYFLLVWIAYHVGMWTWRGTTFGGIVMRIKVVRTNGDPIDFPVALVRSLSSFFSALPLFIGFFWAGWDKQKQSWHDKIAGTVIVKIPKDMPLV